METGYDKEQAKKTIERLMEEGKAEDEKCLHELLKEPEWLDSVRIKEIVKDKAFSLVYADDKGHATDEECIFTVYGALSKKDLPPLKLAVKQLDQSKLRFLKQSIRLDGLGMTQFRDAVDAAAAVCDLFDRVFEEGALERWKDGLLGDEEKLLDMSNKLVTHVNDAIGQQHIPFDSGIDPLGVMDSLLQKGYIRTEDNMVQYSEGKRGPDGKRR
ncbi:hypothetical protein LshimejAT787_1204750 [Lyophyllum shimeji]|uniref:Uncharacterized protein n=1 Tax=Lyophyllum shimeji TaxID=47721 RepID=A0A9P3PWQ3_LYOSH|nr:hypothetical protein LshimejAT787_1204750 [Lyophyllum shimeji]